jgi:hypothetical protein
LAGLPLFATFLAALPFLAGIHRRATLFQAALPIPARDLFATRCVALTSLLWLPVLAAAGVAVLKSGLEWKGAAPALIDCGAAATLITIALLSLRLMEIESPPQLCDVSVVLGGRRLFGGVSHPASGAHTRVLRDRIRGTLCARMARHAGVVSGGPARSPETFLASSGGIGACDSLADSAAVDHSATRPTVPAIRIPGSFYARR